ncbi:hypothetical protein TELCIR_11091 [Teladorsagia circumcincta]|uniref:Uncharacterized protein n=1 Tax=Teladorsagia circumcincta TaxID=45464 RepID=A0A2G9UBQ0_TELCI|nr:hypothetical protein TELCIR_11091 [Teladorsagia circumcincta]
MQFGLYNDLWWPTEDDIQSLKNRNETCRTLNEAGTENEGKDKRATPRRAKIDESAAAASAACCCCSCCGVIFRANATLRYAPMQRKYHPSPSQANTLWSAIRCRAADIAKSLLHSHRPAESPADVFNSPEPLEKEMTYTQRTAFVRRTPHVFRRSVYPRKTIENPRRTKHIP